MLGMDRSTPGCKTSPQHWLSRSLSPVGRLQVPISRAAGIPWSHIRTGLVSVRGEGRTSPVLMDTGAGSKMSSKRGSTGLSRIMEPTSKSGRSPETDLQLPKTLAREHRCKWWRQRAEATWEERVPWLQHTSTCGLPRQALPEAERWVLDPRSSWHSPGATKSGWSPLGG